MKVALVLERLGGVASRAALIDVTSRRAVDRALRRGRIVRDGHGRYALPSTAAALRSANRLSGALGLRSAATYWGWEQKLPPRDPDVIVPRKRNVPPEKREGVHLHWIDLGPEDVHAGIVTSKRCTLEHCLRNLPFDEALAIADSALRHGDIDSPGLVALADAMRGPGAAQAREVARSGDARAANPFESALRAIALRVRGLHFVPQLAIRAGRETVCPDLVEPDLQVIAEADSFAWHGSRRALRRDCRRYNWLVLRGWLVLRFAWEDVMFDPHYVQKCLELAAELASRRARRRRPARKAA